MNSRTGKVALYGLGILILCLTILFFVLSFGRSYMGVDIRLEDETWKVISVDPSGLASAIGIESGDVVTAVNGEDPSRFAATSRFQVRRQVLGPLTTRPNHDPLVVLELQRERTTVQLRLKRIDRDRFNPLTRSYTDIRHAECQQHGHFRVFVETPIHPGIGRFQRKAARFLTVASDSVAHDVAEHVTGSRIKLDLVSRLVRVIREPALQVAREHDDEQRSRVARTARKCHFQP